MRLPLFGGKIREDYELEQLFALSLFLVVVWCESNVKIRQKSNFRDTSLRFPLIYEMYRKKRACFRKKNVAVICNFSLIVKTFDQTIS